MVPDVFIALRFNGISGLGGFWSCTAITILAIAATCSDVMPSDCNVDDVEISGTESAAMDV